MAGYVGLLDSTGNAVTSTNPQPVQIADGNSILGLGPLSNQDGNTSSRGLPVWAQNGIFNGATWDRQRGNVDTGALVTAVGATTTQTTADQTNYNGRGIKIVLDMTTVGTGSVTLTLQGKDTASGKYYTILAGAAVATNSTNVYTVFPGATAAANVAANDILPRTWRIVVTANNANAATYTVGASVIL